MKAAVRVKTRRARGERAAGTAGAAASEGRTWRLRLEEALAESEQKFRAVFEQATIGIALGSLDGRCLRANRAACNFIGATEAEVCRLSIQDIVHPDDLGLSSDVFPRLVAGEIPSYTVERRYVRRDKRIVWGRASVSLVRDGRGRPQCLVGVMADVTHEKKIEEQQAALSRLGYSLNSAVARDQAARIILDAASELFGWDAGYLHLYSAKTGQITRVLTVDTIGGRRVPVTPAAQPSEPSPMMRKVMREGGQLLNRGQESAPTVELRPFGDKQRRSASLLFVPVRSSGTAVGILSIQSHTPAAYGPDDLKLLQTLADQCGDALERIKLTEALREAEAKYRSIFENATEGIFQTTPDGRYLSANAALAQMLGFQSPAELIAGVTNIERQFYVRPEARNELRRLLESQVGVHGFEVECYRKDGSTFWTSVSGRAVRDESGAVVYYEGTAQDITRRKEALEALNDSERKLRLIAENTTDVIFAFDMNRQPLYINPAVEQLTGYTFAEIQAQKFVNWIHPDDRERMLRLWEELYTSKGFSEVEFRLITRTGQMKWCSSTWGPIRDEAGRQIGVQGREHDITELKRAETQKAALSQLGHRLSAAADPSQAARIIFEVAAELFRLDAGYLHLYSAMTGEFTRVLTMDTIEGRRVPVPPAAQPSEPSPMMRKVMREGGQLLNRGQDSAPAMELRPFGDKQRRSASLMFVPVRSAGAAVGILSLQSYTPMAYAHDDLKMLQVLADECGDALERIKLTEALREAEAKYRSIFENATEGIFQTTSEGKYLSANPALARMFGYQSPEELMASVTDIARRTYVEPAKREELKRLLAEQGAAQGFEVERYRKDGSVCWISADVHTVWDGSGQVLYYEGTNRDITEIVRAREALARSKEELERRVRERTAELEAVNQTLRREMADRQRLERQVLESVEREQQRIGRDLHDGLCQLLAGIKFKAAALRAGLRRKHLPEAASFGDIEDLIDQTIRQGYGLAHGLNPVNLPSRDVSLALKELAASVENAFGVHCACNFQSPVTIGEQTVANHLYRIAQEAIHNAIKHGKAREITITLTEQSGQVALAIQDNGVGLPEPAKRKTGMGLQNMKARAGMMGAALELRAGACGTVVTCVLTNPNAETRPG